MEASLQPLKEEVAGGSAWRFVWPFARRRWEFPWLVEVGIGCVEGPGSCFDFSPQTKPEWPPYIYIYMHVYEYTDTHLWLWECGL